MNIEQLSLEYVQKTTLPDFGRFVRAGNSIFLQSDMDPELDIQEATHRNMVSQLMRTQQVDPKAVIDAGYYRLHFPPLMDGLKFYDFSASLAQSHGLVYDDIQRLVTGDIAQGMLQAIPGFIVEAGK